MSQEEKQKRRAKKMMSGRDFREGIIFILSLKDDNLIILDN